MNRETTQELLERLKKHIYEFDPEDYAEGVTREALQSDYEISKYIAGTLNMTEIRLLWLLRSSPRVGETSRFMHAAETLMKAYQEFYDLQEVLPEKKENEA